MKITLPPEMASYLQEQLATGHYASPEDFLREALALLKARDELRHQKLQLLRKELQVGLDQVERGECAPLDMEQLWRRVEQQLDAEQTAIKEAS
jgi:antitoxin ParD1/3/4